MENADVGRGYRAPDAPLIEPAIGVVVDRVLVVVNMVLVVLDRVLVVGVISVVHHHPGDEMKRTREDGCIQ